MGTYLDFDSGYPHLMADRQAQLAVFLFPQKLVPKFFKHFPHCVPVQCHSGEPFELLYVLSYISRICHHNLSVNSLYCNRSLIPHHERMIRNIALLSREWDNGHVNAGQSRQRDKPVYLLCHPPGRDNAPAQDVLSYNEPLIFFHVVQHALTLKP